MEHDLREGLRGRAYKEVGKSWDNKGERIFLREGKSYVRGILLNLNSYGLCLNILNMILLYFPIKAGHVFCNRNVIYVYKTM